MKPAVKRILITGSNGLLGQKLVKYCLENHIDFLATANSSNRYSLCPDLHFSILDITKPDQVKGIVSRYQPTHIINAAAMTNVDACEAQVENCNAVNVNGVKHLLSEAKALNIHLIQISTDFIFDGKKKLYHEHDLANPLSVYGASKWKAEALIAESKYPNVTILRTSILYGTGESLNKSNIFNWAMEALRADKELTIVNDQFRTPTFVADLVQACFKVIEQNVKGVFNVAGGELNSMYEFILLLADYVGAPRSLVQAISSDQLNQNAKRPQSSGLIIDKAIHTFAYQPTSFVESLLEIDPNN